MLIWPIWWKQRKVCSLGKSYFNEAFLINQPIYPKNVENLIGICCVCVVFYQLKVYLSNSQHFAHTMTKTKNLSPICAYVIL